MMTKEKFNALRHKPDDYPTDADLRGRKTPWFDKAWKFIALPPPAPNHPGPAGGENTGAEWSTVYKEHRKVTPEQARRILAEDRPDPEKVFIEYLEKQGVRVPLDVEQQVEELSSQLATVGWFFKDKFGRIRPNEWAEAAGKLKVFPESSTARSPSYPSNHALIGAFVAEWLAEKYPRFRDPLVVIGKQLGWNRVLAGWHFPSDYGMARVLANRLKEMYEGP